MKELSVKEKAKHYDEAIERAKAYQGLRSEMEIIFPELKESEEEKIRKELIEYIKDQQSTFISAPDCRDKYEEEENNKYNSWIAWLEKQGEQKFPSLSEKDIVCLKRILDFLRGEHNSYTGKDFTNEIVVLEWLITHPALIHSSELQQVQNEQKLDDKVSLNFKKGDILYEQKTMSILLVYERNGSWLMTFCDYWMLKEKFHVEFPYENYGFVREMSLVPATKEQCDLLFQKMKEAGYEWDADKKELKKIVTPIFHIGDRVRYKGHACDGVITEITNTDYICGNAKLPISTQNKLELVEQNDAWSEED